MVEMNRSYKDHFDRNLGEINITTQVLEKIAATAASEVKGVSKLHRNFQREVGGYLGFDTQGSGAKVRWEDGQLAIDVSIHLLYGYSVPEVATNVQYRVKEQILFMTDLVVNQVNVHIVTIETMPNEYQVSEG